VALHNWHKMLQIMLQTHSCTQWSVIRCKLDSCISLPIVGVVVCWSGWEARLLDAGGFEEPPSYGASVQGGNIVVCCRLLIRVL